VTQQHGYVLFFIQLHTRQVHLAGITRQPHRRIGRSAGRNLLGSLDEEATFRFLIRDRGSNFTAASMTSGARSVRRSSVRRSRPRTRTPTPLPSGGSAPCAGNASTIS
jgi:hypothetical protein